MNSGTIPEVLVQAVVLVGGRGYLYALGSKVFTYAACALTCNATQVLALFAQETLMSNNAWFRV